MESRQRRDADQESHLKVQTMTDDILSKAMQQRDEFIKTRTFKDIFVWSQEVKRGPSAWNSHSAIAYHDKLILIGGCDD